MLRSRILTKLVQRSQRFTKFGAEIPEIPKIVAKVVEIHKICAKNMEIHKIDAYIQEIHERLRPLPFEESSYVVVRKNDGVETTANEKSFCVDVRKNDGVEITATYQWNRRCYDADVTPIVRDPMDDDRIPVKSGAEIVPVPHEPSESEKIKHDLTHIQRQSTSGIKQTNRAHH